MAVYKCSLWQPTNIMVDMELEDSFHILPNFTIYEVANKEAPDDPKFVIEDRYGWMIMKMLQISRDHFGWLDINSAYRTQAYNDSLPNSTPNSQHCHMKAIDIKGITQNGTVSEWIDWWRNLCREFQTIGAIGLYDWGFHIEIESDKRYGATEFQVRDYRTRKVEKPWL